VTNAVEITMFIRIIILSYKATAKRIAQLVKAEVK
jgi:hypothetical protein